MLRGPCFSHCRIYWDKLPYVNASWFEDTVHDSKEGTLYPQSGSRGLPEGWGDLLSETFLETSSWTHPEVCFHGDCKD